MNLETCFICKKPVLEVVGEYQLFDAYNLHEEDDHILDNNQLGKCHAKCIAGSDLKTFWHAKTLESMRIQQFEVAPIDENSQLLFRRFNNQFTILNNDATHISFTYSQLQKAKQCNEGLLIPYGGEMNIQLDLVAGAQLCRKLKKKGKIPLLEIFTELEIEDKLLRPDLLKEANLLFENDKKHGMYCKNGWVSGKSKYQLLVPTEAVLKIVEVTGV